MLGKNLVLLTSQCSKKEKNMMLCAFKPYKSTGFTPKRLILVH
jgi:hypothetical protein